jgi:type II secretory pathway component PulF
MESLLLSWPTLILLGLGLRMALRLTYGVRGPDPGDPVYEFLRITGWVLIILGLTPAILGGLFSVVGGIIVVLAAATLIEVITQRRAAQRRSLCALLAVIVERRQRLDASSLLDSHALRGRVGRKAKKLFEALDAGTPLDQAVRENPRALPREAIAYLGAGETMKAESAALRELSRTDHGELSTVWRACIDRVSYLACVLTIMVVFLTFVMIKIVPSFAQIFREFNLELPAPTMLAVRVSTLFVTFLAVPVILGLLILVLGAGIVGVCYLCDFPVLRPFADRWFRGRRLGDVLRILAVATEERQPLADVLNRVAFDYPSATIRRQLAPAAEALHGGTQWHEALFKSRVVSGAEVALLKTAEQAGNLPWTFRQIAARREKRAVYLLASALQVLYPIVILLVGTFVGFFVISLFIPLVKLIEGLAR